MLTMDDGIAGSENCCTGTADDGEKFAMATGTPY